MPVITNIQTIPTAPKPGRIVGRSGRRNERTLPPILVSEIHLERYFMYTKIHLQASPSSV